jgi:hypothetical protein
MLLAAMTAIIGALLTFWLIRRHPPSILRLSSVSRVTGSSAAILCSARDKLDALTQVQALRWVHRNIWEAGVVRIEFGAAFALLFGGAVSTFVT